jgi:predicted nuclease with RNAse H fold
MFLGVDLAGSEETITGAAVINEEIGVYSLHTDDELLDLVERHEPAVTALDAPLSFYGEPFRDGDRAL